MINIKADASGFLEIELYSNGKEIKYWSITGLKPNQELELKVLGEE